MDLNLADRERVKYEKVYAADLYRGGPGVSLVPEAILMGIKRGDSLADYGCGGGHACVRFQDYGIDVIGIDIADSLIPDYRHYVPFVQAPLWDLPPDFPITDWSFSAHVLEHLPREKVDASLAEIANHTAKGFFVEVFHLPDIMGQHLGMSLHLTVEPWEWWRERIERYFIISHVAQNMRVNGEGIKETRCRCIPREKKESTPIADFKKKLRPQKSAESVVIVGHGPSGIGSGLGKNIDDHNNVIRFAWRREQPPEDYGTKVDYIVASLRNHGDIINEGTVPEKGTWIFGRPGQISYELIQSLSLRLKKFRPCMGREVWPWHYRFKELGATGYIDPRQGEPGLIPSFSQGTGAIIMACNRINPKKISLVGFDNVWSGKQEEYNDWNAIRRGEKPRKSGHDLKTERILIDELMEYYNVEIGPLANTVL